MDKTERTLFMKALAGSVKEYVTRVEDRIRHWVSDELKALTSLVDERFATLPAPRHGINGKDGKDGAPGRDGIDGKDGATGPEGKPGLRGIDGKNGAPGLAGKDGAPGKDGIDGRPGPEGTRGAA